MGVSIVVPVYNEEKYIKNCLVGLTSQQEPADEIIVVDNNCTDKTMEIAKQFPVRIVQEKKQGMTYARNRGFNEASREIIGRCDADCTPKPNWVKKIKANFQQREIAGLLGPLLFTDVPWPNKFASKVYITFSKSTLGHYPLMGPNMGLTKKIWNKIKDEVHLDNKQIHEDIDLSIHIAKNGGEIFYDRTLIMPSSARRIKHNPLSFFMEYPVRYFNTIRIHK